MARYKNQEYKHIWYIKYSQRDGCYTVYAGHQQGLVVLVDKKDDNLYHIVNALQNGKERFDNTFPTVVKQKGYKTLSEALTAVDTYVGFEKAKQALEKAEAVVSEPPKENPVVSEPLKENPVSPEPPKEKSAYEQIIEALGVELDELKEDWMRPFNHGQVIGEAIKGKFSEIEVEILLRALTYSIGESARNRLHYVVAPYCDLCERTVAVDDDFDEHFICGGCDRVVCMDNHAHTDSHEYCERCVPDGMHICPYNNELYDKGDTSCHCWGDCDHTDCTTRINLETGIDEFGGACTWYAMGTKIRCSKCAESLKPKTCGCCGKERPLIKCDACEGEGISPYDNKSCELCEGRGTLCRECRESFEEDDDDDDGFERCSCGKIFFPNDGEGNYLHMQTCDGGPDDIEVDDQPLVVKTGFDLWKCLNCQDVLHKDNYADHVCKKGDDLS